MRMWIVALMLVLTGCGSVAETPMGSHLPAEDQTVVAVTTVGEAGRGEDIFRHGAGGAPGCINCHALTPGAFAMGPDLHGIYARAATREAGVSADDYIRQSILQPDEFLTPGYRDMMYRQYAEALTEQDIADLIAFLAAL
ncbi:MAG: c-type cytochrome [Chloroflexota bacterium]|nr:c-type cytochrome [Chloroflexota bacterium]